MNECLLMKWWWKFGKEDSSLWKNIICQKYEMSVSDWLPNQEMGRKFSRIWEDIIKVVQINPRISNLFMRNLCL